MWFCSVLLRLSWARLLLGNLKMSLLLKGTTWPSRDANFYPGRHLALRDDSLFWCDRGWGDFILRGFLLLLLLLFLRSKRTAGLKPCLVTVSSVIMGEKIWSAESRAEWNWNKVKEAENAGRNVMCSLYP